MANGETPQDRVRRFVSDMYSVEQQALAQLVTAPDMAGDPALGAMYRHHLTETEGQAEMVAERLEALGGSPSVVKDAVMRVGGKGFLLFARVMPETPGRLAAHSYSYEAMEWAGYRMLELVAGMAGDARTAEVARTIAAQERAMMDRIEGGLHVAEQVSHGSTPAGEMGSHVRTHLNEMHALEMQGRKLAEKSERIGGPEELKALYAAMSEDAELHARMVEDRLDSLGGSVSRLKDAAMALGGTEWGLFFQALSDTPMKLAAFVYAFAHLKIAGYGLLRRTARRAGDAETAVLCERLERSERDRSRSLTELFPVAAGSWEAASTR